VEGIISVGYVTHLITLKQIKRIEMEVAFNEPIYSRSQIEIFSSVTEDFVRKNFELSYFLQRHQRSEQFLSQRCIV